MPRQSMIKVCLSAFLLISVLLNGCATKAPNRSTADPDETSEIVIAPASANIGKVAMVNRQARFAVLSFPLGAVPANEQKLNVYRQGLKVGELRVSGPQRDTNTVADILSGEIQVSDEVRED